VMKPGGVLEVIFFSPSVITERLILIVRQIIEEDLIFPCSQIKRRPRPPPINVDLPIGQSLPSSALSSRTSGGTPSSEALPISSSPEDPIDFPRTIKKKTSLVPVKDSSSFTRNRSMSSKSSFQKPSLSLLPQAEHEDQHPRDHRKLKAAWDAMLHEVFLSADIVTVLPFYLSSCFEDVRTHPTFHIPLPPNSDVEPDPSSSRQSTPQPFDYPSYFSISSVTKRSGEMAKQASLITTSSQLIGASGGGKIPNSVCVMHLAKTVATIKACKQTIWKEYEKLYTASSQRRVVRTIADVKNENVHRTSTVEDDFEREWTNWEL
jgi:hypothetical protein